MLKDRKIYFAILAVFLIAIVPCSYAQTDSPYSRYGLGRLSNQATGPSKGMGGVGYGLHTGQSANPMNPASYALVDSLTFIFDIGVNYNNTSYKEGANKSTKNNGGLDYVTLLFPVSKKMGVSFGLLPYSSTGYQLGIKKSSTIEDHEVTYRVDHQGTGGLSQVYLGFGYELPLKGLSLGANVSYLFGVMNRSNSITSITGQATDPTYENTRLHINGLKVDLGLQYRIGLPEYSSLTFGAVYSPQLDNKGKLTRTRNQGTGTETINDEKVSAGIPHVFGFGTAYNKNDKLLLAADVTYEKWEDVKFSSLYAADDLTSKNRFNNRIKVAAGAEFRVSPYSKSYLQRIKYRGGINYSTSYINVNNEGGTPQGYNEYGASLGFGFPVTDTYGLGRRTSYVNVTFEYKYLKPEFKGMVSEQYFGVTLNLNLNQLWFLQRKIN